MIQTCIVVEVVVVVVVVDVVVVVVVDVGWVIAFGRISLKKVVMVMIKKKVLILKDGRICNQALHSGDHNDKLLLLLCY